MKKQHQALIGAAALSLAVAGSLAGAMPAKADDCIECPPSPRATALGNVLLKFDAIMEKHTPILDKTTPLLNAMDKIHEIVMKW